MHLSEFTDDRYDIDVRQSGNDVTVTTASIVSYLDTLIRYADRKSTEYFNSPLRFLEHILTFQSAAKMPHPSLEYTTVQPALDTYPKNATRNNANGTDTDVLERLKIREICEGWGMYRDAAEWQNYSSMFHPGAYITTSWTQGRLDDFIASSKEGFEKQTPHGPFPYILHRICGQTVDIQGDRAISKMKVTITCRIMLDDVEMDNEADTRFFFFLSKHGQGRWGVNFMTLLFDKDKMVPVVPGKAFDIPENEAKQYPSGYRYLAWAESKAGRPPKMDLNAHGPERDILYAKCKTWLEGGEVKPNLTGHDIVQH
jgi:hypothetical protein